VFGRNLLDLLANQLACIIHDDLQKSTKALLRNESDDLLKKQSVFWGAVAVRVSQVGE
jgi:hypothetical protein